MKRGDHLNLKEVVLYGLAGGKITWIRGPVTGRIHENSPDQHSGACRESCRANACVANATHA